MSRVLVKNELRAGHAEETRLQESQDCSWLQRQGGQNWVSGEWVSRDELNGRWGSRWVGEQVDELTGNG